MSYLWFLSVFHIFVQYGALETNSFRVGIVTLALAYFLTWVGLWVNSRTKQVVNHASATAENRLRQMSRRFNHATPPSLQEAEQVHSSQLCDHASQ
jgi:hypothetical protein